MAVLYQNNFNGGEISPEANGLVNYEDYTKSLSRCQNFFTNLINTATYRAGTRFIAACKDTTATRLFPFQFSETQAFVVEAGTNYMRFFQDRGQILDGGSIYEEASPYSAADLATVKFIQSRDVMYLTHKSYAPRTLSRLAATNWAIAEFELDPAPFQAINKTNTTLDASGVTGSITITASSALFASTDIGSQWYFEENVASLYNQWEAHKSYVIGDLVTNAGHVYKAAASDTSGNRAPVHVDGTVDDSEMGWEYLHSGWGYAEITAYTSATVVSATVLSRLPDSATATTKNWAAPVFSATRGHPVVARFHDDRLCLFGNEDVALSVTGDYNNFSKKANLTEVTAQSAIITGLATAEAEYGRWLISDPKGLVLGTNKAEWLLTSGNNSTALTPTGSPRAILLSSVGSADVQAVRIDNQIFFVADSQQALGGLNYEFSADGFIDTKPSVLAGHLFKSNAKRIITQRQPLERTYVVFDDGRLVSMTTRKSENVRGFNEIVLGGVGDANGNPPKVIDACVVAGINDGEEDLYLLVERYINGATVRFIEVLEAPYRIGKAKEDMLYLDCGVTYSGSLATSISGLGYLEGEVVTVYNNGNIETHTVTSGGITLNNAATKAHIGYSYEGILRTLPLTTSTRQDQAGSLGVVRSLSACKVMLWESLGGFVRGVQSGIEQPFIYELGQPMDVPQALFTGFQSVSLADRNQESLQIEIVQSLPVPMTVQAIIYDMESGRL